MSKSETCGNCAWRDPLGGHCLCSCAAFAGWWREPERLGCYFWSDLPRINGGLEEPEEATDAVSG